MERLIKSGEIVPKKSADIKHSKIGLGFEKLDRDVFDPKKAYPFVGESGVKSSGYSFSIESNSRISISYS